MLVFLNSGPQQRSNKNFNPYQRNFSKIHLILGPTPPAITRLGEFTAILPSGKDDMKWGLRHARMCYACNINGYVKVYVLNRDSFCPMLGNMKNSFIPYVSTCPRMLTSKTANPRCQIVDQVDWELYLLLGFRSCVRVVSVKTNLWLYSASTCKWLLSGM